MPEMMARVEAEDFDTWLRSHRSQATQRRGYGISVACAGRQVMRASRC
jgi:hypothetical protein